MFVLCFIQYYIIKSKHSYCRIRHSTQLIASQETKLVQEEASRSFKFCVSLIKLNLELFELFPPKVEILLI